MIEEDDRNLKRGPPSPLRFGPGWRGSHRDREACWWLGTLLEVIVYPLVETTGLCGSVRAAGVNANLPATMHTKNSALELGGEAPSFSYRFAAFLQDHLLIGPILNELIKRNIYRVKIITKQIRR